MFTVILAVLYFEQVHVCTEQLIVIEHLSDQPWRHETVVELEITTHYPSSKPTIHPASKPAGPQTVLDTEPFLRPKRIRKNNLLQTLHHASLAPYGVAARLRAESSTSIQDDARTVETSFSPNTRRKKRS